jgi:preprotein translocase subunit SecG
MELILLIVQIIVAIALIAFVLLQRSENDGFGMGSGSGGGLMSSRGQANFMTKTTAILAFVFMANSLLLTIITTYDGSSSIIDEIEVQEPFAVPTDGKTSKKDAAPVTVPAVSESSVPEKKASDKIVPDINLKDTVAPKIESAPIAPVLELKKKAPAVTSGEINAPKAE